MKTFRAILLGVACTATLWAAALVLFGGFHTRLFGVAIRSNNPDRLIVFACIALAGYFVAGGRVPRAALRRLGNGARVVHALITRPGFVAGALALALAITAMAASTRIAGGADAYGYVSQADLWLSGHLVIEQP